MSKRLNITVDEDVYDFVKRNSDNRSSFVNEILKEAKKRRLEDDLVRACKEEQSDQVYQAELAPWDMLAGDGLEPEDA